MLEAFYWKVMCFTESRAINLGFIHIFINAYCFLNCQMFEPPSVWNLVHDKWNNVQYIIYTVVYTMIIITVIKLIITIIIQLTGFCFISWKTYAFIFFSPYFNILYVIFNWITIVFLYLNLKYFTNIFI